MWGEEIRRDVGVGDAGIQTGTGTGGNKRANQSQMRRFERQDSLTATTHPLMIRKKERKKEKEALTAHGSEGSGRKKKRVTE